MKSTKRLLTEASIGFLLGTFVFVWFIMCSRAPAKENLRDYQLELTGDSVKVYDGPRLVGAVPWTNGKIDSVILTDNQ